VDTLRVSKRDWPVILAQLERSNGFRGGSEKRKEIRLAYREMLPLPMELIHPGGSRSRFLVRSRNLSRTGLGFLHGGFLYNGTYCVVMLITAESNITPVPGRITRCRHVYGKVHEVGVRFDKAIDMRPYGGNL
jgi:hypothetical protein